jgi:hypothetical protein
MVIWRIRLRLLFFRSRMLRRLLTPLGAWRMGRGGLHLGHLGFYKEEVAFGPLQREEALLLAAGLLPGSPASPTCTNRRRTSTLSIMAIKWRSALGGSEALFAKSVVPLNFFYSDRIWR